MPLELAGSGEAPAVPSARAEDPFEVEAHKTAEVLDSLEELDAAAFEDDGTELEEAFDEERDMVLF